MKNSCLWINGVKVYDAKGITDNFSIADVRGYYMAGSLIPWLIAHGEYETADALRSIPAGEDPDRHLFDIFNNTYVRPNYHVGKKGSEGAVVSQGSFNAGSSYSLSSGIITSGAAYSTSFKQTSYRVSSRMYEYEFEFELGSFRARSFNISSFRAFLSSYVFSSYIGAFPSSFAWGSFSMQELFNTDPVSVVLKNFTSEPLNRYGYGIHII